MAALVAVFREVKRVLRDDGVLFLNLGDSYCASPPGNTTKGVSAKSGLHGVNGASGKYRETLEAGHKTKRDTSQLAGLKPKDLIGVPWRVAFALQADGWYLRSDIIWAKPNPMPESVRDRPTKAHEYIFLLTKNPRYFWDATAVAEPSEGTGNGKTWNESKAMGFRGDTKHPTTDAIEAGLAIPSFAPNPAGRNIRSVWTIATAPFAEAHFATFPPALAERCIKAGTSEKGACSACGAPWVRVVERERIEVTPPTVEPVRYDGLGKHRGIDRTATVHTPGWRKREPEVARTTGWQPTCACHERYPHPDDPPTEPCAVLDPFGGAGTVSLVAERLGRDSIYIDLRGDYAAMARKRIYNDAPMFTSVGVS